MFWSRRQSGPGLYRKNSNGTGGEELIVPEKSDIWPYQWAGDNLLYFGGNGIPSYDILMFYFTERKSRPLIQTPFIDGDGAVSPDGKWLAYENNETGRYEVYVTTFPPSDTKLTVTAESGVDSLWSPDGRKLFYVNAATRELLAVDVKPGNPPGFGPPRRIHAGPLDWTSAHSFDIHPTQQQILLQVSTAPQIDITVLLDWQASLKK